MIYCGFRAMIEKRLSGKRVEEFKADYYKAWESYKEVGKRENCASLYTDLYLNDKGIGDTIENL